MKTLWQKISKRMRGVGEPGWGENYSGYGDLSKNMGSSHVWIVLPPYDWEVQGE